MLTTASIPTLWNICLTIELQVLGNEIGFLAPLKNHFPVVVSLFHPT